MTADRTRRGRLIDSTGTKHATSENNREIDKSHRLEAMYRRLINDRPRAPLIFVSKHLISHLRDRVHVSLAMTRQSWPSIAREPWTRCICCVPNLCRYLHLYLRLHLYFPSVIPSFRAVGCCHSIWPSYWSRDFYRFQENRRVGCASWSPNSLNNESFSTPSGKSRTGKD